MNIKYFLLSLMLIISGLIITPQVQANPNTSNGTGSSAEHCTTYSISKIIAVINAGTVEVCLIFPVSVSYGSQFRIVGRIAGPDNALGVAFVQTWSIVTNSMVGCNLAPGTSLTQASFNNAATSGSDAYAILTMDDDHCSGVLSYTLTVASIQIVSWHGIFNVFADISSVDNGDCAQAQISGSVFFDATTNSANTIRECVSYPEVISAQEGSTQNFYFTINTVLPRVAGTGYVLSTVDNGGCASTGCASFTTSDCGSSSPILVSHKNSLLGVSPPPTNNFISETYKMAYTNAQNCDVSIIKGIDIKLSGVSIGINFPLLSFSPHPLAQGLQQNQLSGAINSFNINYENSEQCATPIFESNTLNGLFASTSVGAVTNFCVSYPKIVQPGQVFVIRAQAQYPVLVSGNLATINVNSNSLFGGLGGCTAGSDLTPSFTIGSNSNEVDLHDAVAITMTGNNCDGFMSFQLALAASPTIPRLMLIVPFSVRTTSDHLTIDSWPTLTSTVTNSGALTLSGSINVANSGTQHVIIDTWPALVSTVTNSGSLNVVNSGGQTVTLSGTVNNVNSGAITNTLTGTVNNVNSGTLNNVLSGTVNNVNSGSINNALSGSITVTNAGGQSIVVTSWPQLQAVLSGSINIHQDQACGATITCKSNSNVTAIVTGNTTVNQNNNLNVQLSLIPYYILLIAVAFFAVFADWKGDALYWFIDLILSIYLLIIRPENSVIPRAIFLGWVFIVAYQAVALLSNKKAKNLSGDE